MIKIKEILERNFEGWIDEMRCLLEDGADPDQVPLLFKKIINTLLLNNEIMEGISTCRISYS